MMLRETSILVLALGLTCIAVPAQSQSQSTGVINDSQNPPTFNSQDRVVNDHDGNAFMEEVGPRQALPPRKVTLPQDLSSVGVATDQNGNIIPQINRTGQSMIQAGGSQIQSFNEVPALTAPYAPYGVPVGGFGTTFIPTGPLMAVPNPVYQQPNINLRVGPMIFGNGVPYAYPYPYGYAPPANLLVPVVPNGTTTFSSPFGSSSVTNTTRVFGPSTVPPFTMPNH